MQAYKTPFTYSVVFNFAPNPDQHGTMNIHVEAGGEVIYQELGAENTTSAGGGLNLASGTSCSCVVQYLNKDGVQTGSDSCSITV